MLFARLNLQVWFMVEYEEWGWVRDGVNLRFLDNTVNPMTLPIALLNTLTLAESF